MKSSTRVRIGQQDLQESKPLHHVLLFKRKATPVGNRPDFCLARYVNTDFSRISKQTKILRSRASSMTLSDLEKLAQASQSLIAGQLKVKGH